MVKIDATNCPVCGGLLKYYDHVTRGILSKNRVKKSITLQRLHCSVCGRYHRELPDDIFPFKQYDSEIIRGVIEGFITCDTVGYEDYPCEMTMLRWKSQKLYPPFAE